MRTRWRCCWLGRMWDLGAAAAPRPRLSSAVGRASKPTGGRRTSKALLGAFAAWAARRPPPPAAARLLDGDPRSRLHRAARRAPPPPPRRAYAPPLARSGGRHRALDQRRLAHHHASRGCRRAARSQTPAPISALPRSISTNTPSGKTSRAPSPSARRSASVPSTPGSSVPPAASSLRRVGAHFPRERPPRPLRAPRCGRRRRGRPLTLSLEAVRRGAAARSGAPRGRSVAFAICQRHVSLSHATVAAPEARTCSKRSAPTVHRDVVLLGLQPVRAGDAAAARRSISVTCSPGIERQQLERRLADPVALLLARRVVGDRVLARAGSRSSARRGRAARAAARRCRRCARLTQLEVGVVLEARGSRAPRA